MENAPNFAQASAIATRVMESDADRAQVVFNTFESAISYRQTIINCDNLAKGTEDKIAEGGSGMPEFLKVTSSSLEQYQARRISTNWPRLHHLLRHARVRHERGELSHGCHGQRVKNAGDDRALTLRYNRARQASITTELIEIISGAAALEG